MSTPNRARRTAGMDDDEIHVLIVDDHPGVRSAIAALIDRTPGLPVVGSLSSGAAAIEGVERLRPTVVVMDLGMPGIDGVEATRQICKSKTAPVVVAFSGSRELWREARAAGAAHTILKDEDPATLLETIRVTARRWEVSAAGGGPFREGDDDPTPPDQPHLMARLEVILHGLRASSRSEPRARDSSFARLFARFALTGLLAMVLIGVVGFVVIRHSATASAIRQAKELTALAGRGIVEPLLTPRLLAGDRAAMSRLDQAVHRRILRGTSIVRVKIWDARGRIVYSDATALIGARFPLGPDELAVLRRDTIAADASDLTRRENRSERGFRKLVEVYVGVRASDGTRLLYENYERSSTISATSQRQWESLLPALGGALAVLYLIQLPLAYSLARRLRRRQQEREELLRRAIDASDLERRRIAGDLHDGAVQRLAGVSLALAAAAGRNGTSERDQLRATVSEAATETRETIRELRTLLVDIYPPTLHRSGLPAALSDLVAPLRAAGVAVTVDVPEDAHLSDDTEALFYRVAQEAIRNSRTHGDASEVRIALVRGSDHTRLLIEDNGRGFAPVDIGEGEPKGHFGLRLMRDLVDHAGGRLEIDSAPGRGTSISIVMPSP